MSGVPELPVIRMTGLPARLPAAAVGKDFWPVACALVGDLAPDGLDLALDQGDATGEPHLWLLLHRLGGEETGAVAGLGLAGYLAGRGRRTLLVDADEAERVLTVRSGRSFKAGWLDMVRYGTSLAAASVPVAWDGCGGGALGLGSYCPPEIAPDEVQNLLLGLAGHVDDVVVVCGMGAAARPWHGAATGCWYCWDREEDKQGVLEAVLEDLQEQGLSCQGILACGVESGEASTAGAGLEPASVGPAAAEVPTAAAAVNDQPPGISGPDVVLPPGASDDSHSSGIFRVVALTGLVVLAMLAVVIWKFTDFGRLVPEPGPPAVTHDSRSLPVARDSADRVAALVDSVLTAAADTSAVGFRDSRLVKPAVSGAVAAVDTVSGAARKPASGATAATGEAAADPAAAWAEVESAFRDPVGRGGWCLHVYSLRDSTAALREIKMIEARGIRAVGAPVVLRDARRWFRVYVGSFASRREALAAEPALKWKLHTDWARPSVLPASAWD